MPNNYRGVCWHAGNGKYRVKIAERTLGYYDDDREAALFYDACARLLFGPDAVLNFPKTSSPVEHRVQANTKLTKAGLLRA